MLSDIKLLVSILFMLCTCGIQAQDCFGTGLETILSSKGQIDSFPLHYPGCRAFGSTLVIREAEPGAIVNLDSLSQLVSISRDLRIENNVALSNLNGLHHLVQVDGSLEISGNAMLKDLSGLDSLKNIGRGLSLAANSSPMSLLGINQLSLLGGELQITNNVQFTRLIGLENLREIGDLSISGNELLRNLKGLGNLKRINGALSLNGTSLTDVFDLSSVRKLNGALAINHNDILRSLSGLDSIDHTTISDLVVENNDNLSLCAVASICAYLEAGKSEELCWFG